MAGGKAFPVAGQRTAAGQLFLDGLKGLPVDDGFVVVLQQELRLAAVVWDFSVGQVVGGDVLLLEQIPGVLFVVQDTQDFGGGPAAAGAKRWGNALLGQFPGDAIGTLALGEKLMIDASYHSCLRLVNGKGAVAQHIAEQRVVAEHGSPLHGLGLPPAGALRDLPGLLLCHAGHDRQTELPVVVSGVDVVVQEEDPDAQRVQLAGHTEGIHSVSGEPGDFFGQDEVDLSGLGQRDHAVERRAACGGGPRKPFVREHTGGDPAGLLLDVVCKKSALVLQGVALVFVVCGDPAVSGDPQRTGSR